MQQCVFVFFSPAVLFHSNIKRVLSKQQTSLLWIFEHKSDLTGWLVFVVMFAVIADSLLASAESPLHVWQVEKSSFQALASLMWLRGGTTVAF